MAASDPIDSLRRLSPVSDADAAAVFGVAGREDLLAGLTVLRTRRVVRRRPLVIAVAVLLVAAIATAGTWAVLRAPARETTSVECMNGSSDAIIQSISGDPAADCAAAWQGAFGTAAPPLAAYDNGIGGVTVIPSSDKPWPGWTPIKSQDIALIELQGSLDDDINGLNSTCMDAATATSFAEAKLAQFGFTGWTVTVRDPSSANEPGMCTSGEVIEPAAKTVTLIPFNGTQIAQTGPLHDFTSRLRVATQQCESLPEAVASVRSAAAAVGLAASDYELDATTDNSLRCALIYENVGGAANVVVRGPTS